MEVKRDRYLKRLKGRMHNGMIKIVTGIRRCGKTYLLFDLFGGYLHSLGVDDAHLIELALDDEQNAQYRDPAALSAFLNGLIDDRGEYYVLLDEVQYAISGKELRNPEEPPALYGVLNGLLRKHNVDVYVTGSNSKMLSTDVLTQFRGRGDEVRVRPLSFAEFMQGFVGDRYEAWAEYVLYGGMPLILSMRSDELKVHYLENLFQETYVKDIVSRNHLSKTQELEDLLDVVASNVGALTNPTKLEATFKSVLHSRISTNTIVAYLGYLEEAFLVEEAKRYDVKGRKHIGSPKKYYFADTGLRNARLGFRQTEENHLMENIIYNELRLRGFSVDVGVIEKRGSRAGEPYRKSLEVDFVANLGSKRYYLQSAYQLPDAEKIAQEKATLRAIDDSFKKIILVRDVVKPTRDEHGILTMSILDFLADDASLEV
ncbi:MAG: ATP-binding protein [Coriobacteriales bacterium]|jgi:predicted AAA+ superfamily ATPase|nr:ATP-binding protein [Coriobacteriales bacterium]